MGAAVSGATPLPTPPGWALDGAAREDARTRANAWASAWNGDVRRVMSTGTRDDFVETLAVIDIASPMPADALVERDDARRWLAQRVTRAMGTSASLDEESVELVPNPEPGVAILQGRVTLGDRVARLAAAPTGARHLMVVLLVPAAEEVLYTDVFEDTVDAIEGFEAPVAPFDAATTRALAVVLWLLGAGALAFGWTRRSLPRPGARVAGRQVAAVVAGLAVLTTLLAGAWLGGAAEPLKLAGTSPWGLAMELGLIGLVMAGLVIVATERWERRLQPVASAPPRGSFAAAGAPTTRRPVTESSADVEITTAAYPLVAEGGDPPAATGGTTVGLAPPAPPTAGPSGRALAPRDSERQTQVTPRPEPPLADDEPDTVPRARFGSDDGAASLVDAEDHTTPAPSSARDRSSPRIIPERRPGPTDSHPALDAPLPPRRGS